MPGRGRGRVVSRQEGNYQGIELQTGVVPLQSHLWLCDLCPFWTCFSSGTPPAGEDGAGAAAAHPSAVIWRVSPACFRVAWSQSRPGRYLYKPSTPGPRPCHGERRKVTDSRKCGLEGTAGGQGRAALPIRRGHSEAASRTTFPIQHVIGRLCYGYCKATHGQ